MCQKISQELRSQYILGYIPSDQSRSGAFRRIEVKLNGSHGRYSVPTRDGYLAPEGEEKAGGNPH